MSDVKILELLRRSRRLLTRALADTPEDVRPNSDRSLRRNREIIGFVREIDRELDQVKTNAG